LIEQLADSPTMGNLGRMPMRTFVLLQCILVTASLRSQASPSRQGVLAATGRRYYSEDTATKVDSCNVQDLYLAKTQLSTEVVVGADDLDSFIAEHKTMIGIQLTYLDQKLAAGRSTGNCGKITIKGNVLQVEGKEITFDENIAGWLESLITQGDFADPVELLLAVEKAMDEIEDDDEFSAAEALQNELGALQACSGVSSNDVSDNVEDEISKCKAAEEFLTNLGKDNKIIKEPAIAHQRQYHAILADISAAEVKTNEVQTSTKGVQDSLATISKNVDNLGDEAGKVTRKLQGATEKMHEVKNIMDGTQHKFELISTLTERALEQTKAIKNVEEKVQQIIFNAVTYHRVSLVQLIEWYGKKPTQQPIDTYPVSSRLDDLVNHCQKYTAQGITMHGGALHIQGTAVLDESELKESSSDMVSVLSENKICASMTTDTTGKYLKHFDSQMTREWTHTMKEIDRHTQAFKYIKIHRDESDAVSDMERSLDIYLEVFRSNTFYKQYLSYWRKYFPAIKVAVVQMHDDVSKVLDVLKDKQAEEKIQQNKLNGFIQDLRTQLDQVEAQLSDATLLKDSIKDKLNSLQTEIKKCTAELERLTRLAEEQNSQLQKAESKYVEFIQQGSVLLSMRSKSRLS